MLLLRLRVSAFLRLVAQLKELNEKCEMRNDKWKMISALLPRE
jgi:hypothetical protein